MTLNNEIIEKRVNRMIEEWGFYDLNEFFDYTHEELKEKFDTGDYRGVYDFDITYTDGTISVNELVFVMKYSDKSKDMQGIILLPIYCSDERLFEYWEKRGDNEWVEEHIEKIETHFIPTDDFKRGCGPDELILVASFIDKIKPSDKYVTYEGVNYQVVTTPLDENGVPLQLHIKKEEIEDKDTWTKMEEDQFMGKIKRTFVNQIGDFIEEESIICSVENDTIHCLDYKMPAINSNNIPLYMSKEKWEECQIENTYENGVRLCFVPIDFDYIPYSPEEEL